MEFEWGGVGLGTRAPINAPNNSMFVFADRQKINCVHDKQLWGVNWSFFRVRMVHCLIGTIVHGDLELVGLRAHN